VNSSVGVRVTLLIIGTSWKGRPVKVGTLKAPQDSQGKGAPGVGHPGRRVGNDTLARNSE
jgi:hypothetical protein